MAIAHLEWTPGGGVNQEVRYKKQSDVSYTLYDTVSSGTNSIDIPDLDPNTLYEFYVINKCVFDFESASEVVDGALVECPSLSIEQSTLSLTVDFTHLGGDIDSYTVEIYEMPSETLINSEDVGSPSGSISVTFDSLIDNTYYKIKVIPKVGDEFENDDCTITQRTLGCGGGYTLAPDGSYCYIVDEVDPDPPTGGTPEDTQAATNNVYSALGSFIYDFGFNSNGTGTANRIDLSNTFWVNGPGDGGNHTTTDGPLNRCGLWSTTTLNNQDIGFSVCISLDASSTYYIGIAGDNNCKIVIDSTVIVDQDVTAVAAQIGFGAASTFKAWHIFPVTLSSGPHIIELIGHNEDGVASMGAEIYHNTPTELQTATSYADLDLIFSTKDYIGQPVQLGSDSLGYTCPSGYSLAACVDPLKCRRITTALPS